MSDLLEALGLGCLTIAAGMVAIPLGIAVAGICLLFLGFTMPDREGTE